MADLPDDVLSERAQHLLRVLVESYIREGQPVGSRSLTRDSGLQLSSATVRNVMADLEEYGFVTSPHTSAGRVPTDKGYRFFVDTLLRQRQQGSIDDVIDELSRRLDEEESRDPKSLVAVASQVLSSLTHLAGVVTIPRQPHQSLSQIEFLPLSDERVLVVMVVNGRDVDPDWTGYRLTLPADALSADNAVRVVYENEYDHQGDGFHQFADLDLFDSLRDFNHRHRAQQALEIEGEFWGVGHGTFLCMLR